ncbi:MAG: ABC transporter ATP-binding protein [Lactobacillus sp.]|nr:ABC transporter ATP-binding protein [Lactobacillus sp.]
MLKVLKRAIRQYTRLSWVSPIAVTGEVIVEMMIPYLVGELIDDGIRKGNMNFIVNKGILLLILTIVSVTCGVAASITSSKAAAGFAANLRHDMFYKTQDFAFENIDKFSSASLVTRMTTDVNNVQQSYQMLIRVAVRAPMLLIVSIFMAFVVSPSLASIFVILAPIFAVVLVLILLAGFKVFPKIFKAYDRLNQVVRENVRGIREVKTYVREDQQIDKFNDTSDKIYSLFVKAMKIINLNSLAIMLILNISLLLLSWFGAHQIVGGSLQTGQLVSMFSYSNSVLFSLMIVAMISVQIVMSMSSGRRIAEVLTEKPAITNPENPITKLENGEIIFDDVSFKYSDGSKNAIDDVNLTIKSGETIGIIGETGSSKSTLVNLIPRLYDVTSGSIKVSGHDVKDYDLKTLRDGVAMVLQKNVLFSGTIMSNLLWGNEHASEEEVIKACQIAHADGFIREMEDGYNTHIEQGGANVSGGQKQRITIARALLKKPKILILDDSTSAVDTATELAIRTALREDLASTTKIIISQRIDSIKDADRIIVMHKGQIQDIGTHDELLVKNDLYQKIAKYQGQGGQAE